MAVGAVEHSKGTVGATVAVGAVAILDGGWQDRAVKGLHQPPLEIIQ